MNFFNLKNIYSYIIKGGVPFDIHEKVLTTNKMVKEENDELKTQNALLRKENRFLKKELKYLKERDRIKSEIFLAILPYIDLPRNVKAEVDRLNKETTDLITKI